MSGKSAKHQIAHLVVLSPWMLPSEPAWSEPGSNSKPYPPKRLEFLRVRLEFQRRRAEALGHLAEMRRLREELSAQAQEMRSLIKAARAAATSPQGANWRIPDPPPSKPAPPHAPTGEIASLTRREVEVLRLIAERHSTKEIASILGISFKTAVCHRTHVMEKLGIHEVAGLVRAAIRNHLVEP